MTKLLIGVVVAAFVVVVAFLAIDPNIKSQDTGVVLTSSQNVFQATIDGQVFKPGTYALGENPTMIDLIAAAGGITTNADEFAYYDTAIIDKGESYYIAPKYDESDICSDSPIVKVNINIDDEETLMKVNGITSSIASSIVSYRSDSGSFETIEELMEVYGIGMATYKKVRNYVILHE